MATSREELRQDLTAALEAAPELPKEDREHLADVFLDRLNEGYVLVPRDTVRGPQPSGPPGMAAWNRRWVALALVLTFVILVVPATLHHHFPFFLLLPVAVFFAVKRARSRWSSTVTPG